MWFENNLEYLADCSASVEKWIKYAQLAAQYKYNWFNSRQQPAEHYQNTVRWQIRLDLHNLHVTEELQSRLPAENFPGGKAFIFLSPSVDSFVLNFFNFCCLCA